MAHECPDCGYTCHCGGDIDDCTFNFDEDIVRCHHCVDRVEDDDDFYDEGENESIEQDGYA